MPETEKRARLAELDSAIKRIGCEIMGVPDSLIGSDYHNRLLENLGILMNLRRIIG